MLTGTSICWLAIMCKVLYLHCCYHFLVVFFLLEILLISKSEWRKLIIAVRYDSKFSRVPGNLNLLDRETCPTIISWLYVLFYYHFKIMVSLVFFFFFFNEEMTRDKDIMEELTGSAFISAVVQWISKNFQQSKIYYLQGIDILLKK